MAPICSSLVLLRVRSLSDFCQLMRHRFVVVKSMFMEVNPLTFSCLVLGSSVVAPPAHLPSGRSCCDGSTVGKRSYAVVAALLLASSVSRVVNSGPKGSRGYGCSNSKRIRAGKVTASSSLPMISWLCGGATGKEHTWNAIAGHSCGRFKDDLQTERAKRDLYRYQHYYNRYTAHRISLKQEDGDLKENIKQKISTLKERNSGILTNYNSLTDGLNMLLRSRQIISYSYPFAYYMFGEELFKDEMRDQERELKQNLFEDQQQQLESNIEKLSMLLGKEFNNFDDDGVIELMRNLVNMSRVVDKLCKSMYKCIEDELLYPLHQAHNIAPYNSKRLERVS